jgi:ABC-2 type transport system permease protein
VTALSPLTYFSRGVRAATAGSDPTVALLVLAALATAFFVAGAVAVPKTE